MQDTVRPDCFTFWLQAPVVYIFPFPPSLSKSFSPLVHLLSQSTFLCFLLEVTRLTFLCSRSSYPDNLVKVRTFLR